MPLHPVDQCLDTFKYVSILLKKEKNLKMNLGFLGGLNALGARHYSFSKISG